MSDHKPGCDALGGYGNGIGACSCGAVSDTPRTDAVRFEMQGSSMGAKAIRYADLADALERDLARVSAERDEVLQGGDRVRGAYIAAMRERLQAAEADARLGQVLLRYIDRLTDPTDEDTLEKIVAGMSAEVSPIIQKAHDAAIAAREWK